MAQQAQPQTVFDWKSWKRAARDPKLTTYLNHGVKAKMCETTPFVNSLGSQYTASRAQTELACDSTESNHQIAKYLLKDASHAWSAMVMRTTPFPVVLLQEILPNHSPSLLQTSSSRMPSMASSTDNVGESNLRTPMGCHRPVLP